MKRRTFPIPKSGRSPYVKKGKTPFRYPFPIGKEAARLRDKRASDPNYHPEPLFPSDEKFNEDRQRRRMEREEVHKARKARERAWLYSAVHAKHDAPKEGA